MAVSLAPLYFALWLTLEPMSQRHTHGGQEAESPLSAADAAAFKAAIEALFGLGMGVALDICSKVARAE